MAKFQLLNGKTWCKVLMFGSSTLPFSQNKSQFFWPFHHLCPRPGTLDLFNGDLELATFYGQMDILKDSMVIL